MQDDNMEQQAALPSDRLFDEPRREPSDIMNEMIEQHSPFKIVAMTSGGNDSTAAILAVREYIDFACYIDTGTALPGVREHVESVCATIGVPLKVQIRRVDTTDERPPVEAQP